MDQPCHQETDAYNKEATLKTGVTERILEGLEPLRFRQWGWLVILLIWEILVLACSSRDVVLPVRADQPKGHMVRIAGMHPSSRAQRAAPLWFPFKPVSLLTAPCPFTLDPNCV